MKIVSKHHLTEPLQWMYAETVGENIDYLEESRIRELIRNSVVPYFEGYYPESKQMIKDSYRFFLSTYSVQEFLDCFDSLGLEMSAPENARNFFLWIWEENFKEEDWHKDDKEEYTIDNSSGFLDQLKHLPF